jgi:hypothetical protein
MNTTSAEGLPELPEPVGFATEMSAITVASADSCVTVDVPTYTADQMRAYGELCRRTASPAEGRMGEWDRVLRSSVPDRHKGCTSPVGAVQNYIGELEQALMAATGKLSVDDALGESPADSPATLGDQSVEYSIYQLEQMAMGGPLAFDSAAIRTAAALLRTLAKKPEGRAVAWQYRVAKALRDGWSEWQPCTENLYDELVEFGEYGGRKAQARALYATPAAEQGEGA